MKNEHRIRFSIPMRTIYNFQGEGFYEETLEDHFRLIVCEELLRKSIDFHFDYHAFEVKDGFGLELKFRGDPIDLNTLVKNLIKNKFRLGLVVQKFEKYNWIEVYNDSKRLKYKNFDIFT